MPWPQARSAGKGLKIPERRDALALVGCPRLFARLRGFLGEPRGGSLGLQGTRPFYLKRRLAKKQQKPISAGHKPSPGRCLGLWGEGRECQALGARRTSLCQGCWVGGALRGLGPLGAGFGLWPLVAWDAGNKGPKATGIHGALGLPRTIQGQRPLGLPRTTALGPYRVN
jgi:hypothetical protein